MRAFRLLAIGVGGVVGLIAFLFLALQVPAVQRMAASALSKAVSGQHGGVDFDGPSGLFPTSMSFERISYRDGQRQWLMADNVHFRWSLASLLGGLFEVEELTAERVALLQRQFRPWRSRDRGAGERQDRGRGRRRCEQPGRCQDGVGLLTGSDEARSSMTTCRRCHAP